MTDEIECAFSGRIGTEPQARTSKTGKPWLSFSVAVGSDDATQWVQVALFGDAAADMAARLHKGDRVYCEGRIKLNVWADKDGRERSGLSVSSFLVQPLGQIGRKRPAKPKADRAISPDTQALRDWQRPSTAGHGAAEAEIPFTPEVR